MKNDEKIIALGEAAITALSQMTAEQVARGAEAATVGAAVWTAAMEINPPAPEGFQHVRVEVSDREYRMLRREAASLGSGLVSAAVRRRMVRQPDWFTHDGWTERPRGIVKAERLRAAQ